MDDDEDLNNSDNVNNSVNNNPDLASNPAFAAAIAEKDAIIAALNSRIACLEHSISNQSAVLAQLNQNFISLNNNVINSTDGGVRRKKSKPPTVSGPMDKFVVASASTSDAQIGVTSERVHDEMMDSASLSSNLNQQHVPVVSFADVVGNGKPKPMPLQLGTTDRAAIGNIITLLDEFQPGDYDFVQLKGGTPPRIFPKDSAIKESIVRLFKENNIQFNSYSSKNEKQQSFIVRGLNHGDESANISHICRSLADVGILTTIDCSRFLTGHMKRAGDSYNTVLYRFTLLPYSDASSLAQIKLINGFRVTIEKMRKSVVIQCHRCQRFQHTAKQCSFEYRCVQCIINHGPGCCPRKINNKLPIKCCNCAAAGLKGGNHTANNLSACPFFKNNHSTLYNKFVNMTKSNLEQGSVSNSKTVHHAEAVPRPGSSGDSFIGPANANNSTSPSKKKAKVKSTNWTTVTNKKSSKSNKAAGSSNSTLKIGKSHTVSTSGNSNHRVEALVGAFSKLLREFCNAS